MRQITLSALEYPTETKALVRLQEDVLRINDPKAFKAHNKPTLGWSSTDSQLRSAGANSATGTGEATITDGFSWSTAAGYRSYLKKHIRPNGVASHWGKSMHSKSLNG